MKKIGVIFLFLSLFVLLCACSSSKTNSSDKIENNEHTTKEVVTDSNYNTTGTIDVNSYPETPVQGASILKANSFSDGCAWVKYECDLNEYYGLIDTKGNLLLSVPNAKNVYRVNDIEKGLGYYELTNNETSLVNSKGEIVASNKNGDYDLIIDCAEGYALLYKKVADISTVKHMYGLMDSNGNFVYPFTDWGAEPEDHNLFTSKQPAYGFYAGEGVYVVSIVDNLNLTESFIIFNSKTQTTFYMYQVRENIIRENIFSFTNGSAIVLDSERSGKGYITSFYTTEYINTSLIEIPDYISVLPNHFILYSDGNYREISIENDYGLAVHDNVLVKRYNEDLTVYTNAENMTNYTISKYVASNVNLNFYEDLGFMTIYGADGKQYFTMIDKNIGKEYFEPICYTTVKYGDEKIVYQDIEKDDCFKVVDVNGRVILNDLEYEDMEAFSENMAAVKISENNYGYVDIYGNLVLSKVIF